MPSMWARWWWTDTWSSKSWAGGTSRQSGWPRTWNTILLLLLKFKSQRLTTLRQRMMRWEFWNRFLVFGRSRLGSMPSRNITVMTHNSKNIFEKNSFPWENTHTLSNSSIPSCTQALMASTTWWSSKFWASISLKSSKDTITKESRSI